MECNYNKKSEMNNWFATLVLGFLVLEINICSQESNAPYSADGDVKSIEYYVAFTEATKYFLFGNYVQAVSLYNECLKMRPSSGAVHFQLSRIYLNSGNTLLAAEQAKKACEFNKGNKWYLQGLADIYQVAQKYDSAVIVLKQILIVDPENISNIFSIAALDEKLGKNEEALLYYSKIDSKIGVSKEVSMGRYRIFNGQKLYKPAIEQLMIALKLSDDEYSINGMIAEFYRSQHEIDSAFKYYRKIYPAYKNDALVVFSFAEFLLEQGNTDTAKAMLLDVIMATSIDNRIKSGYFFKLLQDEHLFELAKPLLDTLVTVYYRIYYNDIHAMSIYSDIEVRLGNYQHASNALRSIIAVDNRNYIAFEQLIYAMNVLGKTDSVIFYSNEAMIKFEEKPILYLFNGAAKLQTGNYSEACKVLEKGLALTEDNSLKLEFYGLLAECYQNLKQYSNSVAAFNSALTIDKDNLGIKNNYAYYMALREENLMLARRMSRSVIRSQQHNSTYLDTYAWVLFKMKKYHKAKKFIIKAMESGGRTNEEILVHCGEVYVSLKAYSEAIDCFDRAMLLVKESEKEELNKRINEVRNLRSR